MSLIDANPTVMCVRKRVINFDPGLRQIQSFCFGTPSRVRVLPSI